MCRASFAGLVWVKNYPKQAPSELRKLSCESSLLGKKRYKMKKQLKAGKNYQNVTKCVFFLLNNYV